MKFCAGSKPARGVLEICSVEDIWQWSRMEIRLNVFPRSTMPQRQFIIIIIIIIINFRKKDLIFSSYWAFILIVVSFILIFWTFLQVQFQIFSSSCLISHVMQVFSLPMLLMFHFLNLQTNLCYVFDGFCD